jgi:hypothetical protein
MEQKSSHNGFSKQEISQIILNTPLNFTDADVAEFRRLSELPNSDCAPLYRQDIITCNKNIQVEETDNTEWFNAREERDEWFDACEHTEETAKLQTRLKQKEMNEISTEQQEMKNRTTLQSTQTNTSTQLTKIQKFKQLQEIFVQNDEESRTPFYNLKLVANQIQGLLFSRILYDFTALTNSKSQIANFDQQ